MRKPILITSILLALLIGGGLVWCISSGVIDLERFAVRKLASTSSVPLYRATIHGKVVDHQGAPIPGLSVGIYAMGITEEDLGAHERTTNADGCFSVEVRDAKYVEVMSRHKGIITSTGGTALVRQKLDYQSQPALVSAYASVDTPLILAFPPPVSAPALTRDKGVPPIPPDGTPIIISIDPADSPEHRIEVRYWNERLQQSELAQGIYPYRIEVHAPEGELLDYHSGRHKVSKAPDTGYTSTLTYEVPDTLPSGKWDYGLNEKFFVRFNDGTHGIVIFSLYSRRLSGLKWSATYNSSPGSIRFAK